MKRIGTGFQQDTGTVHSIHHTLLPEAPCTHTPDNARLRADFPCTLRRELCPRELASRFHTPATILTHHIPESATKNCRKCRFSHQETLSAGIFVTDGEKKREFARSGALGLPGAGHGVQSGVLWGLEINFQRASGCSLAPRARSSAPMAFAAGVFCIP